MEHGRPGWHHNHGHHAADGPAIRQCRSAPFRWTKPVPVRATSMPLVPSSATSWCQQARSAAVSTPGGRGIPVPGTAIRHTCPEPLRRGVDGVALVEAGAPRIGCSAPLSLQVIGGTLGTRVAACWQCRLVSAGGLGVGRQQRDGQAAQHADGDDREEAEGHGVRRAAG
jgi:hypothetical protein